MGSPSLEHHDAPAIRRPGPPLVVPRTVPDPVVDPAAERPVLARGWRRHVALVLRPHCGRFEVAPRPRGQIVDPDHASVAIGPGIAALERDPGAVRGPGHRVALEAKMSRPGAVRIHDPVVVGRY